MRTIPLTAESPAELAAEAKCLLLEYGSACFYGDPTDSRTARHDAVAAAIDRLAAIATIQASAIASQEPVPFGFARVVCTPDTPMGPAEHDIEMVEGDCPAGEGWFPLYTAATQVRPASGEAKWDDGTEDADGNPLVTIRADELAALAEFASGPGLSAWRIDGDMIRREVLALRMQQVAVNALRPAAPTSTPSAAKKD